MPERLDSQLLSTLHLSIPSWILPRRRASEMKGKASAFLKQGLSFIMALVKAKSVVAKSKSSAIKARLLLFGLLRNKKLLISTINHKMHVLLGQERREHASDGEDHGKAIVLHGNATEEALPDNAGPRILEHGEAVEEGYYDGDDDYPDLRHSLFDMEGEDDDELVNGTGSVIDLVRNSMEDGTEFILEDEIDHVADVFIRRFHRQMKIQKQESFKRYKEMLARGV